MLAAITLKLKKERIHVSRIRMWKFIKQYELHGAIKRKPGSGQPSKITAEVFRVVNQEIDEDDNFCSTTKVVNRQGLLTLLPDSITILSEACLDIH